MDVKVKLLLPDYKDLIKYGEVESDCEFGAPSRRTRVRMIRYMGILYHLKMVNREVVTLKQWDSFTYQENEKDIQILTDDKLAEMLMFSDRDRENNIDAERVYWLCVREIGRRGFTDI